MTTFEIKNQRQIRALRTLLEEGSVAVKDLGEKIGALNARQTVMELRRQGFQGFIRTRRFKVLDQDGKLCLPGEYYIPKELKSFVEEILKEKTTLTFGEAKVVNYNTDIGVE